MMDYEVFKNVITTRIKDFLPSVYAEFDVTVMKVPKINGMREAMILAFETDSCRMSGPNVYFDELYEVFSECGDMDHILQEVAEMIIAFTGTQDFSSDGSAQMEGYRNYVVQMLINTEMNRELLENVPHREFFDLSLIYRLAIPDGDGSGYSTALVTNDLLEELGITAGELDELAEANSRRALPTQLFRMGPDITMMTTEAKMYGAINLLRMDEIAMIAEKMKSNLYLLPSSVHDLMIIREKTFNNKDSLFAMLREGNRKCNKADENLSDNIYYYDRTENSLKLLQADC